MLLQGMVYVQLHQIHSTDHVFIVLGIINELQRHMSTVGYT